VTSGVEPDVSNENPYCELTMMLDCREILQPLYYITVMAALYSRCRHYILQPWFLSFFFLVFPRLFAAVTDWMSSILRHMMWP